MTRIGIGDTGKREGLYRGLMLHMAAPLRDIFCTCKLESLIGYMAKTNELKGIPDLVAISQRF